MQLKLLDILVCPSCQGGLALSATEVDAAGTVHRGRLTCTLCGTVYDIRGGIPRFVQGHPADSSFGFQWNTFRQEQLDSAIGGGLSERRLYSETDSTPQDFDGKRVLEVGCGAGRFLEIASRSQCELVGVDVSTAIDAAAATVKGRTHVHLVQADVYHLPFRPGVFDVCYCIGVAQHTPDPLATLRAMPPMLRQGGRLAVTVYERRRWTLLNGKYLVRPLTKRMNKHLLMTLISVMMPVLFPLTEVFYRLPIVGKFVAFLVPIANYTHLRELSLRERYRLALLDTFDRLAPQFDRPFTEAEVVNTLVSARMGNLRRLPNSGVNVIGERVAQTAGARQEVAMNVDTAVNHQVSSC